MFESNYICLVAGLKEYSLDAETKGFDAKALLEEVLHELSARDAEAVRLLYYYYDCENITAIKASRQLFNPLGNLTREQLDAELVEPTMLPKAMAKVLIAYGDAESEQAQEMDTTVRFERALFEAYYTECAASKSEFMRSWAQTDRNLRNVSAAVTARTLGLPIEESLVGGGDIVDQLLRSSAADFGLRGELSYLDAVIAAVGDQSNLMDKEHKIDLVRWAQAEELAEGHYFDVNAILAYLVKANIVARWAMLDATRGREMFSKLLGEMSGKGLI